MGKMDNKVIIVTGGGRNIGRGISTAFAKEGAKLVITGRTPETLEQASKEMEAEFGTEVLAVPCDNAKEEDIINVVNKTVERFGRIDGIVNNAQTIVSKIHIQDYTMEQFATNFTTGIFAMFLFAKYAFPYLKETKGYIINFASGSGLNGQPDFASYNASKEAVRGFTRTIATEWGQYGISANVLCPVVQTDGMMRWAEKYPERYEALLKEVPMRRFGDAELDIGRVCVFFCSEESKYITGETLCVDGGTVMHP